MYCVHKFFSKENAQKFNKKPSEVKETKTKMHLRKDWHVKFFAF